MQTQPAYEIRPALTAMTRGLTRTQQISPHFNECPEVAGKKLRRGTVVRLTEEQYNRSKGKIRLLEKSQSIIVTKLQTAPPVRGQTQDVVMLDEAAFNEPPTPEPTHEEKADEDLKKLEADIAALDSPKTEEAKVDETPKKTKKGLGKKAQDPVPATE